jgi:hypothetical protein
MKQAFAVTVVSLAMSSSVFAQDQASPCTRDEAMTADAITDYLTTWDNVYRFYKQFGHCYDGGIAEGTQDKVQLLWANSWSTLPQMLRITTKDPKFKRFLWTIIESEAFPQGTFRKVVANATDRCPEVGAEFCLAVKAAAKRAQ